MALVFKPLNTLIRFIRKEIIILSIFFFLLTILLSLAGIYIYSNNELPHWVFQRNIEGLNDLSQSKKIELETNVFGKISVEGDPLNLLGIPDSTGRNITKIVIEPQIDKVLVTNIFYGSKSTEYKLSDYSSSLFLNDFNNKIWLKLAQDRSYRVTDRGSEWLFEINDNVSNNIYQDNFNERNASLNEKFKSLNIDEFSLKYSDFEFVNPTKIDLVIDKASYSLKSIRFAVSGTYTLVVSLEISDDFFASLPPEYNYKKSDLIKINFDEVEATYTFNSYERLPEYNLPSNPIHFWAEQVL